MQLHYSQNSPSVRKVLILAHELGLTNEITLITEKPNPLNTAQPSAASNPLSKIPTLILEDGSTVFDSRVICEYLNDIAQTRGSTKSFFPTDPAQKLRALKLQSLADGIIDAGVIATYEMICRPEQYRFQDWIEAQWIKILRGFNWLEGEAKEGMLAGVDGMTVGEVTVICALDKFGRRNVEDRWENRWPALAAWAEQFKNCEGFKTTRPPFDCLER
ncbi:hypothetical protein HK097_001514 [Rhizophlyctis rosea]|uniref:Uncharacterized protein n=1 Tax=Rhizophlyctis rosea TaxID=64517 RepID=A0AAD5X539_9FUNG|nr:hypothetical protein HK097_001514 [Rhizophlyctis rosea]